MLRTTNLNYFDSKRALIYTANSVMVVFQKAQLVHYERARDDGLLFNLAQMLRELPL